jgi:hypothetical protein
MNEQPLPREAHPIDFVPGIVQRLYELIAELEDHFPSRKFTPDGHLVGSLGEVLAGYYYELELLPASTERHDARARDGRLVQIKATQGTSVASSIRAGPPSGSLAASGWYDRGGLQRSRKSRLGSDWCTSKERTVPSVTESFAQAHDRCSKRGTPFKTRLVEPPPA